MLLALVIMFEESYKLS